MSASEMGCPFVLVLLLVLDSAVRSVPYNISKMNQYVTGFTMVLLLLEGLRCISRKVNSLPANGFGGRTHFVFSTRKHFEHVHEHEE